MGKLYLVPVDSPRDVPGTAPADLGPDADDPALTLDQFRGRIRRHPGELKGLLRNQAFVAGIGNAYSDEILWAARLNPFRRRSSLAHEEVDALYVAIRETLAWSISVLRARVAPTFEKQVRDHLKVHLRGGLPCLRCGGTISQVGGREATSYCRACQR
jgi:formamidopyrimidine-DNA glycosylase